MHWCSRVSAHDQRRAIDHEYFLERDKVAIHVPTELDSRLKKIVVFQPPQTGLSLSARACETKIYEVKQCMMAGKKKRVAVIA